MTFSSKAQKFIVNYFAFTHLLIAAGAGTCAYTTGVVLGTTVNFLQPSLFISLCTGFGYSVQRMLKVKVRPESVPAERLEFLRANGRGMLAVWGVGVIASAVCLELEWGVAGVVMVAVLGGLGIGYAAVPKNWVKGLKALREVPGLKLPLLSVVWSAATVVLPWMLSGENDWPEELWMAAASRTLFIAGLTIPFDLRDADLDHPSMKTLAQTLKPKFTVLLAAYLVMLSSLLWISWDMYWLAFHAFLTAVIILASRKNRPEFFFSVILDGMLVLQLFGLL